MKHNCPDSFVNGRVKTLILGFGKNYLRIFELIRKEYVGKLVTGELLSSGQIVGVMIKT